MKKTLGFFLLIIIMLTGCSSSQSIQYRTQLSPDNKLDIVRKPPAADYSFIHPEKMTELPIYNPNSDQMWQVDLRSSDLTGLDLNNRLNDLLYADFDSKTKWPEKLPKGFNPHLIMELGKNPGLGLRELHKNGITGKGVGIAIIDQGLLVGHVEYKDRLKMYEEIHCGDESAAMHGPAVASIAVGKTVGVAPEADLYYIAETHGVINEQGNFEWDLSWLAKSIDRIVEINKTLPKENKMRVISISLGIGGKMDGYEKVFESIEKAKKEGIYTVYVGSDPFMGLGRDPLKIAEDITSFGKGEFWKNRNYRNDYLLVPMDSRCTASPTGEDDYVFYRKGGMSWAVPYVAALYALACQVNPDITPDIFWKEALNTSETVKVDNNSNRKLGKIVNPLKLINNIQELK
ncbi:MAG: peptidase S8 [Firmicutes bacterium]|nr:peptidase S8 [Bacillota bacterium]